jgi:hypothetical protein
MQNEINTLIEAIKADYAAFNARTGDASRDKFRTEMVEEFNMSVTATKGKKYIKIMQNRSVWGFVVAVDNDKKFPKGTILKAAGWATPARNFGRGNVIDGGYTVRWTGA